MACDGIRLCTRVANGPSWGPSRLISVDSPTRFKPQRMASSARSPINVRPVCGELLIFAEISNSPHTSFSVYRNSSARAVRGGVRRMQAALSDCEGFSGCGDAMAQSPRFDFCRRYHQDSHKRVIRQGAQTYIPGLAERRTEIAAARRHPLSAFATKQVAGSQSALSISRIRQESSRGMTHPSHHAVACRRSDAGSRASGGPVPL
jgi:hypothetical protein